MGFLVGAFMGTTLLMLVMIHHELRQMNDRSQSEDARKKGE